jgi:hypothetical protein
VDIPAGTVKLRIRTPANQALNPLQGLYLSVYAALVDPDNTHYTGTAADKFYNTASVNARFQEIDTSVATYTQRASMEILPYTPKALILQSLDQSTVISSGSNTITARMNYQLYKPLFTPDTIDVQQWVSLFQVTNPVMLVGYWLVEHVVWHFYLVDLIYLIITDIGSYNQITSTYDDVGIA